MLLHRLGIWFGSSRSSHPDHADQLIIPIGVASNHLANGDLQLARVFLLYNGLACFFNSLALQVSTEPHRIITG